MYKDNEDKLIRGLALDGTVRVVVVDGSQLAEVIRVQHDAGPVGAVALARTAVATLLLSATLKERQQVAIQINGDGPLGELYAIADHTGKVRVTAHFPRADVPLAKDGRIPLAKAIGMGRMTVIRTLHDAPPYRGVVPLVDGGIAADLAEYFVSSEQTPTAVSIGEFVGPEGIRACGGVMVQALPGCDEQALARVISRMDALPSIGQLFEDGLEPSKLLDRLFDNFEPMAEYAVKTQCNCTRENFARRLVALGDATLTSLIEDDEEVRVECHFCRSEYLFTAEQVSALLYGARLYFPDEPEKENK
jgi:molecular chaperone Hsp33